MAGDKLAHSPRRRCRTSSGIRRRFVCRRASAAIGWCCVIFPGSPI